MNKVHCCKHFLIFVYKSIHHSTNELPTHTQQTHRYQPKKAVNQLFLNLIEKQGKRMYVNVN
jgi:hypothetical protein